MFREQPVPALDAETVSLISLPGCSATNEALAVLDKFNTATASHDADALQHCLFAKQAYWKDTLALTYHLRTFYTPARIATNFLETKQCRGMRDNWKLESASFVPATPVLQFIDVRLSFRTTSPAATCSGRFLLLPVKSDSGALDWKIWILSTTLENLDLYPEDESLLQVPGKSIHGMNRIETDVLIIGGGNAAAALAARLKTLGVDSVMIERNARVGDNWALRYDKMKFHVPTSFAEMPYTSE
ncbi:hypothetical protein CDD83_6694 [Cordyceps sp. RAO-2017]|nr:hypothetical protein CDD83_6694 [Cordyceps sp. RAO-2017]